MKNRRNLVLLAASCFLASWNSTAANSDDPNHIRMPIMYTNPGSQPKNPLDCIYMHSQILLGYISQPSDDKFDYGVDLIRKLMSESAAQNIKSNRATVAPDEEIMDIFFTVALSNVAERCVEELQVQ